MFYALSFNQDFVASRVNLFVAFAPITEMNHSSFTVRTLAHSLPIMQSYFDKKQVYCFMDKKEHDTFSAINDKVIGPLISTATYIIDHTIGGKGDSTNNAKADNAMDSWFPAEASSREPYHFAQLMNSGRFQLYDFGKE